MSDKARWVDINDLNGVYKNPPRRNWILASRDTVGVHNIIVGINETYIGGMVPEDCHEEEEVLICIQGSGQFITKDDTIDIRPGVCVYNPPWLVHTIVNTGDETLKFIWIYNVPGRYVTE